MNEREKWLIWNTPYDNDPSLRPSDERAAVESWAGENAPADPRDARIEEFRGLLLVARALCSNYLLDIEDTCDTEAGIVRDLLSRIDAALRKEAPDASD